MSLNNFRHIFNYWYIDNLSIDILINDYSLPYKICLYFRANKINI